MTDDDDRRIDDELRRAFAPPAQEHFATMARDAVGTRAVSQPLGRIKSWLLLTAVAALLVAMFAVDPWQRSVGRNEEVRGRQQSGALFVSAFEDALAGDFGGDECFLGAGQIGAASLAVQCEELCGQRLAFVGADDVELVGCCCEQSIPDCIMVSLRVGETPCTVFVVPKAKDPRPVLRGDEGLLLDRRELGPIVLYSLAFQRREEALSSFSL